MTPQLFCLPQLGIKGLDTALSKHVRWILVLCDAGPRLRLHRTQLFERADGSMLTRGVSVKHEDDLAVITHHPLERPSLLHGERRTRRSHRIIMTRNLHGYDIELTLNNIDLMLPTRLTSGYRLTEQ